MKKGNNTMNYSHAFSYVFEDKDWLSKILIAGLISLIPIVGQLYLFGWMIEIVRRQRLIWFALYCAIVGSVAIIATVC